MKPFSLLLIINICLSISLFGQHDTGSRARVDSARKTELSSKEEQLKNEGLKEEVKNNKYRIIVEVIIAGLFMAIGIALTPYFEEKRENWRNKKAALIPVNKIWYSSFYTVRTDTNPSGWYDEEVIISLKKGKVLIESLKEVRFYWKAEAKYYQNKYLYGIWRSKRAQQSQGTMALNIEMQGEYLSGYYVGSNGDLDYQTGPWIIAQSKEKLREAKGKVRNPGFLFESDCTIQPLNRKWHFYHLTQYDNKDIWRYNEIDFSDNTESKSVNTVMKDISPKGEEYSYYVDGGVRGEHLLLFAKHAVVKETDSSILFPFMHALAIDMNCGFISGENWDGKKFIGQAILSKTPIFGINTPGTINDNLKMKLDEEWRKNFAKMIVPKEFFRKKLNLSIKGTNEVYNEFNKELAKRDKDDYIEVDILGYTLFSVDPNLQQWFDEGHLSNMKINLFHLDPAFIPQIKEIPAKWAKQVISYVESINSFLDTHSDYLKKNNVEVNFHSYRHLPAIHGFRVRNSTHFISFASWNSDGTQLVEPINQNFIKIEADGQTIEEMSLKQLFQNWVHAAS